MQIHSLRKALIATTVVSTVLIAMVGLWAILGSPSETSGLNPTDPTLMANSTAMANSTGMPAFAVPKRNFDRLWNRALQPPQDPNLLSAMPSQNAVTSTDFSIQLLGTMIEPAQSIALFRDATGAVDAKGIGQPLKLLPEGVQVVSIEPRVATLSYAGRHLRIELANAIALPIAQNSMNDPFHSQEDMQGTDPNMQSSQMMTSPAAMNSAPAKADDLNWLPDNMNVYGNTPNAQSSMKVQP